MSNLRKKVKYIKILKMQYVKVIYILKNIKKCN